jgi:hypothetical protein
MPSSFSNESRLELTNGARLGEELLIRFDEEDIRAKRAELEKGEEEARRLEAEQRFQYDINDSMAGHMSSDQ